MSSIKTKTIHHLNILVLIILSILLNFLVSGLVRRLELPLYLDTIGTVLAAMIGGNLAAVIVGFFSNAVNVFYDVTMLYYGIINILIGVFASIFHTKRFFERPGKIFFAIVVFTCIGGGLGSFFTYFLEGTDFGVGISAPLASAIYSLTGASKLFSEFCADITIDFFDKAIVVAVAIIIYRMIPDFYKRYTKWVFLFSPASSDEDKEHKGAIKRSLLRKVIVMVIVAEILLGTLASVTGFVLYRQVSVDKFTDIAQGVTKAASIVVDVERIDEFLEKGRDAEGYNEIEKNLYRIKESFPHTTYLYVYKILEDGCHVVFDLDSNEGVKGSKPGTVEEFDPTFVPYLPKLLKGEEIEL